MGAVISDVAGKGPVGNEEQHKGGVDAVQGAHEELALVEQHIQLAQLI